MANLEQLKKTKKWVNFNGGVVNILSDEKGNADSYSSIESKILSIHKTERNYRGEAVTKWEIELEGNAEGEIFSIVLPYNSGTFKSIILSLASYEELKFFTQVKFKPYIKGEFVNIVLYVDNKKLDWVTKTLPPTELINLNGREVKDETKRMEYISSLVDKINERLGAKTAL